MAFQTFSVGDAVTTFNRLVWDLPVNLEITADLVEDLEPDSFGDLAYFGRLILAPDNIQASPQVVGISPTPDRNPGFNDRELTPSWEIFPSAILVEAGGLSVEIPGPRHPDNNHTDEAEYYAWRTSDSVALLIGAFRTAYMALTQAERDATTVTLRDELPPAPLGATADLAGAADGALAAQASLALGATADLAGAADGALAAQASLALGATADLAGAADGALAAQASLAAGPGAIPLTIRGAEQALSLPAIVELIDIDARRLGAGRALITPAPRGGASVRYGGLAYEPLPLRISNVSRGGRSSAEPVLEIGRDGRDILALLTGADNLVGAKVTRTRTLETFLDGAPDADAAQHWPPETWIIDQLLALDTGALSLKWQLASPLTLDSYYLPTRQVLRDVCAWRYRRWDAAATPPAWDYTDAECPYQGAQNFSATDVRLPPGEAGAPRDVCSRRISGCKLRFSGALPIAAFPGVRLGS